MKDVIVSCPNCKAKYNVSKFDPGTKFKCKSCSKFLLVPDMPVDEPDILEEPEPVKPKAKKGGTGVMKRGAKGGKAGARGRSRARDDEDDYDDQPLPRSKKNPPWAIIGVAGGAVLLVIIGGVYAINRNIQIAKELAEQEKKANKKGKYTSDLPDENFKKEPPPNKYADPKKDNVAPGESLGDGKIKPLEDDKEAEGEETIRTDWKKASGDEQAKRMLLRRQLIHLSSDVASKGQTIMEKFKSVFGDPPAENEALAELDALGKDQLPVMLNFMTKLNHVNADDAQVGCALWNRVVEKAQEFWNYENEFNYGAFEDPQEKVKAIIEMKEKCLKEGYKVQEK